MPLNRPPRIHTPLPDDEVEIPSSPALPSPPGAFGWMTTLLPIGASVLVVGLMFAVGGGGGSSLGYFMMLPTMAVGAVVAWLNYRNQTRDYQTKLRQAKTDYQEGLQRVENRLLSLRERDRQIRLDANPDLAACQRRAETQNTRLGERRPSDPDFLAPRIGTGSQPASFRVKAPESRSRPEEFKEIYLKADGMLERFANLPDAPVCARMAKTGSIGIAGPAPEVANMARAIVCHLAIHHWPGEVQVAAVYGPASAGAWQWAGLLPHAARGFDWQNMAGFGADGTATPLLDDLEKELQRREQMLAAQRMVHGGAANQGILLPAMIVVLDHLPAGLSHPGLRKLSSQGPALGVFGIFLTDSPDRVPGECGAVLKVRGPDVTYGETGVDAARITVRADACDPERALAIARALGKIEWPSERDLSQPPVTVTMLQMLEKTAPEELPLEAWWDGGSPFGMLRAPIGKTSATASFTFDLRDQDGSHGPHGLVGGMTGSGKSEVLKAIILALALAHNPHDLNFALVDYKGGAAFNELAQLPHTVGVMTDIESHSSYAERILAALGGELERRKRVLEQARAVFHFSRSHVDDYRGLPIRQPLPHLVIVFDEFAEFKLRHPEESKRLISIARLGRSLGVHLILATQNIQAAIDPQILQNSTFRICLKVSQIEDSMQMVGIPDAIQLPRGRGYFFAQTRTLVQIAYTGGPYRPAVDGPAGEPPANTEAQALVNRMNRAMRALRIPKPPAVWKDPLPERLYLPELLRRRVSGGWDGSRWNPAERENEPGAISAADPILGLSDLPDRQAQPLVELPSGRSGGHALIFGAPGSGKTTLLRTLAAATASLRTPAQAHIYILDFGGQSALKPLEAFPHIGAVISAAENERAERLVRFLRLEAGRRSELFRKAGVSNWVDYNQLPSEPERLAEIYLLIDGFLEVKRSFPIEFIHEVNSLLGGSAAAGMHLVFTGYVQGDIPADIFANIGTRISFHQAAPMEYHQLVGAPSEARLQEEAGRPASPGRGLTAGKPPVEFQAALPTAGKTDREQSAQLNALAEAMRAAWSGPLPKPIETLSAYIPIARISPAPSDAGALEVPLGLDFEALRPAGFALDRDGPTFLIAGATPQCGKTTLLRVWLLNLTARFSPARLRLVLVDCHTRTLARFRRLPHTAGYVGQAAEMTEVFDALGAEFRERSAKMEALYAQDPDGFNREKWLETIPQYAVVIDDYERFASKCEGERKLVADFLGAGGDLGAAVILAGNASELPRDFDDPLMQKMRKQGCGVLLGGAGEIDQFNNAKLAYDQRQAQLPPGRGFLIRRGKTILFQMAAYWEKGEAPDDALRRILDSKWPAPNS